LFLAISMLFLGALPDGMLAPLLDDLFVQRYGTTVAASHWFMVVNLVGALAVVPILARLRTHLPPSMLLAGAAVCNGLLLVLMALPIGFATTMTLRVFEGAADLVMLAVIFDLLGKAGSHSRRGARFGAAGTVLLLGLAVGVIGGGLIGRSAPVLVFCLGGLACFIVAAVAIAAHARFDGLVRSCPAVTTEGHVVTKRATRLWPTMLMAGGDRAIAGLTATTVLFYFAHVLEIDPGMRGVLLGLSLLMLALGAWPAGVIGDRFGHLRIRTTASIVYAGCLALVPLVANTGTMSMLGLMLVFGMAGAFLMPTTLSLASNTGRGSVAMAGYHASGNIGYHLIGVGGAATLLAILSRGETPGAHVYHMIFFVFAAAYTMVSLMAAWMLRGQ
jgi:MFS family permease